jgi:hypothetical protein
MILLFKILVVAGIIFTIFALYAVLSNWYYELKDYIRERKMDANSRN